MIRNKRDLGGMPCGDGRVIRHGCLVRSAQLAMAEPQDLEGIAAVMDLRTPGERGEAPDRTYGRRYLPLPVFDDLTAGISHEQGAESAGIPDMAFLYRRMVAECAASFRRILTAVMEHDFASGAVLWHCTEGKDRCGLTAALLLEMLGADRADIMEDYLKTNEVSLARAEGIREQLLMTHDPAFADSVYRAYIADRRYLEAAWDEMGDDYITGRLGIPGEAQEAFRRRVLEGV